MRKIAILVAVAMAATAPTAAFAAKKKTAAAKPKVFDTTPQNQNEMAGKFVKGAFWNLVVKTGEPETWGNR